MLPGDIVLLPDAGPLITLAYADALDVLFAPGWTVMLVDMVLHEVTRNRTPTSDKLAQWAKRNTLRVLPTRTCGQYANNPAARKAHLGEQAIQEVMSEFALASPPQTGVFLFEDHKIARACFLLPDNCRKISARAFLQFLELKTWIPSASEIEQRAIRSGRAFSPLHFPKANAF